MAGTVHIVGAGLAGLAAAIRLRAAGRNVQVYEAAAQAGGRCRSYFDKELDCRLDNGNHLLLTGNSDAAAYIRAIGAETTFDVPQDAFFPFCDLGSGERWVVRPNRGLLPWWLFIADRRVPGMRPRQFLDALKLRRAGRATVKQVLPSDDDGWRRFWEPLTVAALNTEAEAASAELLWSVLQETFAKGGGACRPMFPQAGLSESLVEPAVQQLPVRFGWRLRSIDGNAGRASLLSFTAGTVALEPEDQVVLAVTPPVAADLLPGLTVPTEFRAIVNAHYRLPPPAGAPPLAGLIGGLAEWVFTKREVVSVTISAADWCADRPAESLAQDIWADVARALELTQPLPPWRIVKEKRATFAATPEQAKRRPGPATALKNLWLAGDWTATGLPATIEGAVRSGHRAAASILSP